MGLFSNIGTTNVQQPSSKRANGLFSGIRTTKDTFFSSIEVPKRPKPDLGSIGKSTNFLGGVEALTRTVEYDAEYNKFKPTPIPQKDIDAVRGKTPFVPSGMTKGGLALETIKGIPEASAKVVVQPTLRGGAALTSFVRGIFGKEAFTPSTPKQEHFFGTDKPITFRSTGEEVVKEGSKAAVPVGVGLFAADIFTGGKGKSVRALIKSLTKVDDVVKTKTLLRSALPDFTNYKGLDELSVKISKTSNANDIARLIDDAQKQAAAQLLKTQRGAKVIKGVSQTADTATNERRFVTRAKALIPGATKIAGETVPRSTNALSKAARELIKTDPTTARNIIETRTDDTAVAIASEWLNKLAREAANTTDKAAQLRAYDDAADIANNMASVLTEHGRSIQAASLMANMTPAGTLHFANKQISNFNKGKPAVKQIPKIEGEVAGEILFEAQKISEMEAGFEQAFRQFKLQQKLQELIPTPLFKKVMNVWKAGLLTGIKTTGLNLFSNLSHGVTEVAKDVPAVAVDRVASLFTGKRTKTLTIRNAFKGIKEGSIKGKRYFATGFDERNIGEKLDYKRVNFGKGKTGRFFQVYTDTVFKSLGAGDQPFYYAAVARSLMDQALASGMNQGLKGKALVKNAYKIVENPTDEMIRYGVTDGTTAVFQNQTVLGKFAKMIQNAPGGAGEFVLPFGRTPSAVAMQAISYSPLGIARAFINHAGKGKFDQRLFVQEAGRAITGTGVMAIGMALSKKGRISGDFPRGDERQQELDKATGKQANRIKVGDRWVSPIILGPAGMTLLLGAHLDKALEEAGSPTEAISIAAARSLKTFTEQTFLTGINNFVSAVTDPERSAANFGRNLTASFVPTIVSDVAKSADPVERRSTTVDEKIKARIPGLRQDLEPQVDVLGRDRARAANPLETMLNPTRPSKDVGTPVTDELTRLAEEGHKVSPTLLGDKKGFEALTPKQNTEMWRLAGELTNDNLTLFMNMKSYEDLPDDLKAEAVETIVSKSRNTARAVTAINLTKDLEGDELLDELVRLKAGGLVNRDVLRVYQDLR